ncbi:MAG: VOC family protein [Pseudolabrys sp.]
MPKLDGILETAIHTEDMVRAPAFYEGVLGLEPIYSDNRLSAYAVAGHDVLLVFRKGTTGQTVVLTGGTIPGHGGDGVLHVAFAISKDELDRWEAHLASRGVDIEGRNDWERGGRSLYFRDPDGHRQRRDCGRSTRHLRVASHRPESTRCPLGSKADICSAQAHVR